MFWEKKDTSPSFRSVRVSKFKKIDETFCTKLQSPALSPHVDVPPRDTNMVAG